MPTIDTLRLDRIQAAMAERGVDALVCRLPENVVYLTDYWPHHGVSVAVILQQGKPQLFAPEVEAEWAQQSWADVHTFGWSLLKDADEYDSFRAALTSVAVALDLDRAVIGVERNAEVVGPTYRAAEPIVPAAPWFALLREVFGTADLPDATGLLAELRAIKTDYEVGKLKAAADIAEIGLRHAIENLEPGMTEAHIGAMAEFVIRSQGPSHCGIRLIRANVEVTAGPNSTKAVLLVPSTDYVTRPGDLVMLESGVVADGYWSDLTYMGVVGEPSERQRELHNILLDAQLAAMDAVRAGVPGSEPDRIARSRLAAAGLDQYFPHITGHGIGLRYHETIPILAPGSEVVLRAGMYTSVEPGIYIPGVGGIRIEDDVLVGESGPIPLSTPRKPW